MDTTEKLILLGGVDEYIKNLSRKTRVDRLAMDWEDLVQAGRTKALEVMKTYDTMPAADLMPVLMKSLRRFYTNLIRKSSAECRNAITIDLSEAFNVSDTDQVKKIFLDLQLSQLRKLLTPQEILVLDCILEPPEDLMDLVFNEYKGTWKYTQVKITRRILAKYLGIKLNELRKTLSSIRAKFNLEYNLATC